MGIFDFLKPNIEEMKSKGDFEGLIKALHHRGDSVREDAFTALRDIGDARAIKPLIVALKNEDEFVRLTAVHALRKIGDVKVVEPLIAVLKDEDWLVRNFAVKALGKIGDVKVVEPLIAVLKDKNKSVRSSAAITLGKIGDVKAVEPLIIALKDEDDDVRKCVIEALEKIGDVRAVEPLKAAVALENTLKDEYEDREELTTELILSKLSKCENTEEEVNIINSLVDGPKFFVMFDNIEDTEKFYATIPYINRKGTITYIRPKLDGYTLFTGGKISNDESLQIFNTIKHSRQEGTAFYDWNPP